MAWNLEIHTIDVAQGESALLVAYTDDGTQFYSMLIDGGLAKYGRQVNDYVSNRLGVRQLNVFVTSHYDTDHSGGQITIFQADNLSSLSMFIGPTVAQTVQTSITAGDNLLLQSTKGMAAFTAVVAGAYNGMRGNFTAQVTNAVNQAVIDFNAANPQPATQDAAMELAFRSAQDYLDDFISDNGPINSVLMKLYNSRIAKTTGKTATLAAIAALPANRNNDTIMAIFRRLSPTPGGANLVRTDGKNFDFFTGGRYSSAYVYNPGNVGSALSGVPSKDLVNYFNTSDGIQKVGSDYNSDIPNVRRPSFVPILGQELWGIADANAPKVYCVAVLQHVLNSGATVSQDNGNGICIGLYVKFGSFGFYTGGDLPADGLNLIPDAVINNPTFGNPPTIPIFKSGHHGSSGSNSQDYLDDTTPNCALISAGYRKFGNNPDAILPRQDVINMFQNFGAMGPYFLTNCKIVRANVPFSSGNNQLVVGNKSRISGDNGFDPGEARGAGLVNPPPKVNRGNIVLTISEAQATSPNISPAPLPMGGIYRGYTVSYFEEQPLPLGVGPRGNTPVTYFF